MLINRQVTETLKKFKKSVLLLGPRQTGKSTLIATLKPDLTINLADQEQYVAFLRDPGLLRKMIRNHKTIFVDEVQKIPSLLNTIQALVDEKKGYRFLLTGSSARKLRRGQANLLPGRLLTYNLGPLSITELGEELEIDRLLALGALPGIVTEADDSLAEKVLRSYATTYLKEEVQAESLTRNLEGFSRFFELIASRSGDFVDFSKFSSQAAIERTSAKRYFDILVDTLLLDSVEAFVKSGRRRLVQHPKYYFFDVGVLNGSLANFQVSLDRKGKLFEHLCLQMILSEAKGRDRDIRVSVYHTEAGAEVDFVVELGKELFAVEIKASNSFGKSDLRGIRSFKEFIGRDVRSIGIYLGKHELNFEGTLVTDLPGAIKEIFA